MTNKVLKLYACERGYRVNKEDIDGTLMMEHLNQHRKNMYLPEDSPIRQLKTREFITKLAELHGWQVEIEENEHSKGK